MFRIKILNDSEWKTIQDDKNKVVEPVLNEKLNSCGSLVYKTLITDNYFDLYKIMNTKVLVEEDGSIQFIGRLLNYVTDFNNTKELTFEGELALLNDVMYPPYDFTGSPAELLTNVINYYNSKCSSFNQIRIGRITVTDKNDYIARSCKDYTTCWEVINTKLIELCGGYIKLRWVLSDGEILRYIDYLDDPGKTSDQKIEFSKNLLDVNKEMTGEQICTVLIPLGAENEETKRRIDISSINDGKNYIESQNVSLYGKIEQVVIYDDITVPENLLTKAQKYLKEIDKNIHTLKINAIDLHALHVDISRYNVGDVVNVCSKPHEIETNMLITERERNLNDPSLDSISLGKEEKTYTSTSNSFKEDNIPTEKDIMDLAKEQTGILLGMKGGYLEFLYEDSENPDIPTGLRIMDSKNKGSATNVILLNSGGFGFSNNGVEGPYFNAWTIDGRLSADAIYTGILQDRVGNFKLNMDTGEISVKKLTLNTPDLIFGVYPNGNYIEITEAESSDGILFKGTGKILMTPSGAFDVRNIVSNILKNQLQISSDGTSNNISLWNNLHSNAAYFANSITMGSQTQVDGTVNNAVNLYNYLVGSNTEANYISMSNDGSNKYLKINNDKSMNRLWLTRTGNNTHLQLANYSSNAGGNIYTNVLEFDSASGILMFNMDYGYPGSFERSSVTGMKMYGVDLNINSKDDMRLTASGLLYLNASADYVTKIWYNGQKLKKAVTISGDQIFISTRTMCFRVTGMTNGCLAVESVTNGTQSESSGGKYRFQTVNYTNFA